MLLFIVIFDVIFGSLMKIKFFYLNGLFQDPVLTVAASLSFKDPFVIPLGREELADRKRCQLAGETR